MVPVGSESAGGKTHLSRLLQIILKVFTLRNHWKLGTPSKGLRVRVRDNVDLLHRRRILGNQEDALCGKALGCEVREQLAGSVKE